LILYDGFMMQRLFETIINEHIVFEDRWSVLLVKIGTIMQELL
jgi:hypothetical protein